MKRLHGKRAKHEPATLELVQSRCVEEGDCWLWRGGINKNGVPVLTSWYPEAGRRRTVNVRRVVAGLLGLEMPAGLVVSCRCCNSLCVAPGHIVVESRSSMNARWYKAHGLGVNALRIRKISWAGLARSPHSEEVVARVRELAALSMSGSAIARELGLPVDFTRRVIRGASRAFPIGASPFAGLGARPAREEKR